jgi:asparagine synthase (glutamine-hydrolysing)
MHARREELARLVAVQPGVAELFQPEEAGAVMMAAAEEDQPAWSLLFYALWHSRHVLGVDPAGDVAEVLSQAARRG